MQKVLNATKKNLFFLCFFNSFFFYSQTEIVGVYYNDNNPSYVVDGGEYTYYTFYEKGIFERNTSGEFGEVDYGKGHYFIKNDSLFLNYDLTELKENSYHLYKYYSNSKDSIVLTIKAFTLDKKPLARLLVDFYPSYKSVILYNGMASIKLKKEKGSQEVHLFDFGLAEHFITIDTQLNYEIDLFMAPTKYYHQHPMAIKGDTFKYKIIKLTKNMIKLQTESKHVMVLKKREIR